MADGGTVSIDDITVYPEDQVAEDVACIEKNGEYIVVTSPKNDGIIRILKEYHYRWTGRRWRKRAHDYRGAAGDRIAELGNAMLNAGIPVCIPDDAAREAAVAGGFEPEHFRWIVKLDDERVQAVWDGRIPEEAYRGMRVGDARYRNYNADADDYGYEERMGDHALVISARYFRQLRINAERYDFILTPDAEALLDAAETAAKSRKRVKPAGPKKRRKTARDVLDSSRDVLEDLKDEDAAECA